MGFLTAIAGRRAKWLVLLVWLVGAGFAGSYAGKFEQAQKNDPSSYLPGAAESSRALEAAKGFPGGDQAPAVVVFRRASGLTAPDRARVAAAKLSLVKNPPPGSAGPAAVTFSRDRTAAALNVPIAIDDDTTLLIDAVDHVRAATGESAGGLVVKVTGPAGFSADAIEIFEGIDGVLLLATAALVAVLLLVIYRSPLLWIVPLLCVGFAEALARGVGYGLIQLGVTINGQSAGIMTILIFGVGTDYALLLIARYREELRRHVSKYDAMRVALRRAGPAIIASAGTVAFALLALMVAELNGTAGLGPIGALGVLIAFVATITLLPALLLAGGRWLFWPFVPRYHSAEHYAASGFWAGLSDRIARSPRRYWVGTLALMGVMVLGFSSFDTGLNSLNSFRGEVDSVEGQRLIARAFPAGSTAPTELIVSRRADVGPVSAALRRSPEVATVMAPQAGPSGATRLAVILRDSPYSQAGFDAIGEIRSIVRAAATGEVLAGGPSAIEADVRAAARRDNFRVMPLALLLVFAILALLLRALVAPVILIATVVASFFGSFGASVFAFDKLFGFPGIDPGLPLFVFIFLVALGVDYNIFLMARVREEAMKVGTREGIRRGLVATGGVITSAGVVLAGTFTVLGVLPLVGLTEIGVAVAFGVLFDTLIVRSITVPAIVDDIGRRVWWPGRLARGEGGGD